MTSWLDQPIKRAPRSGTWSTSAGRSMFWRGMPSMVPSHDHVTEMDLSILIKEDRIGSLLDDSNLRKNPDLPKHLQLWLACNGLECLPLYGDYLIRSFASCAALQQACQVFLKMSNPTVYTWNAIISAHAHLSQGEQALELHGKMQQAGIKVDRVTILCLLKVCRDMGALVQGKLVHMIIIEVALDPDLITGSTLVHMYGKCASLDDAHRVFDTLPKRNVVTWGALITGYAQYGHGAQALRLFKDMQMQGLEPEKATFLGGLKACGIAGAAFEGQLIHDQIIRSGLTIDVAVTSALVEMYGKCSRVSEAHKLFRDASHHDAVSWASFICSVAQHGHACDVIGLLEDMEQHGIRLDQVIYLCILKACSDIAGTVGRCVHDRIIRANYESNVEVGNSLVDMYAKNGSMEEAQKVLSKATARNLVSCSAMISGHVQRGHGLLACAIFDDMREGGIEPDRVCFLGVLKACGTLGATRKGRQIHVDVIKASLDADMDVGNTLADMYAKCGSLEEAHKVFDTMSERDEVSWRAIICGYAQQGKCLVAINLIHIMQLEGFRLDDAIYTSVLVSCRGAGQLEEGQFYFKSMRQDYDISPSVEHYNCMIDLLGRMGHLDDAKHMLETMPVSTNLIGWSTLLNGCRSHGSVEMGTQCIGELFQLDSIDASSYMIMSSLYSSIQQRDLANELQKIRKHRGAQKKPGEAWIEVGTELREFIVNDSLSQDDIFLAKSIRIGLLIKESGHLPDLDIPYDSVCGVKEGTRYDHG